MIGRHFVYCIGSCTHHTPVPFEKGRHYTPSKFGYGVDGYVVPSLDGEFVKVIREVECKRFGRVYTVQSLCGTEFEATEKELL